MADKAVPAIHMGVRVDQNVDRGDGRMSHSSVVYLPGQEKELAKALDKEALKTLTESGAISGFGFEAKSEPEAEEAPEPPKADDKGKTAPAK